MITINQFVTSAGARCDHVIESKCFYNTNNVMMSKTFHQFFKFAPIVYGAVFRLYM